MKNRIAEQLREDARNVMDGNSLDRTLGAADYIQEIEDVLGDVIEAAAVYIRASNTMHAAMQDGINAHGALSNFVGAEDTYEEAVVRARALLPKPNNTPTT